MGNKIYKTIYLDLQQKIKKGLLKSGDLLPSTRELAKDFKCHRFTVMKVCQDLIAEGWIESTERTRYKISAKIPITTSKPPKKTEPCSNSQFILPPVKPVNLEKMKYPIEFWGGQPDLRLFPKDEFRRVLSNALKKVKPEQLNYGATIGLNSCLNEVADYLRKSRNLIDKDFIITNGSQEALHLTCQTFIKPGDKIAVERKGYVPAWRLFESLGAKLIPIAVDAEGLNTDDLEDKIKHHHVKMIYVTPLHQYPTTVTLSPRRRQTLVQLAEKHLIPVLEDDYDHEFHYIRPPPPPLSSETTMGIYICSFSKVLFPGARLGVIGCDPKIVENISIQKFITSRQTDCLSQIGLSAWIRDGGFERHLRRMRRIYQTRFDFMQNQLSEIQRYSKIEWQKPTGGMSIWLNTFKDTKIISDHAKKDGVLFQHEAELDFLQKKGTHLRIGFAGVNEKEIETGFKTLKKILKKANIHS
ncbi:MAG: aminotransferase-like domain-containing protein [Pseudobdellovibrionaceae bacterium]